MERLECGWLGVCLSVESGVLHAVARSTKAASPMLGSVGPVKDAENVAHGYAGFKFFPYFPFFSPFHVRHSGCVGEYEGVLRFVSNRLKKRSQEHVYWNKCGHAPHLILFRLV